RLVAAAGAGNHLDQRLDKAARQALDHPAQGRLPGGRPGDAALLLVAEGRRRRAVRLLGGLRRSAWCAGRLLGAEAPSPNAGGASVDRAPVNGKPVNGKPVNGASVTLAAGEIASGEELAGFAAGARADGRRLVVGALIADDQGRIYLQRRSLSRALFPGSWDLVGGHAEEGEDVRKALAREVREETGWR